MDIYFQYLNFQHHAKKLMITLIKTKLTPCMTITYINYEITITFCDTNMVLFVLLLQQHQLNCHLLLQYRMVILA